MIVTVTVNVEPGQLSGVVGVTVYTAVASLDPVFISVPVMLDPLPDAPPENPVPVGALQEYVVLVGMMFPPIPSTGVTVNVPPPQISAV